LSAELVRDDHALAKTELADDEVGNRTRFFIRITVGVRMHGHSALTGFDMRALGQYPYHVVLDDPRLQ